LDFLLLCFLVKLTITPFLSKYNF